MPLLGFIKKPFRHLFRQCLRLCRRHRMAEGGNQESKVATGFVISQLLSAVASQGGHRLRDIQGGPLLLRAWLAELLYRCSQREERWR
jgi:hypothetical protein